MSGESGVRINRRHQDQIRAKIQADKLIDLLQCYVLKEKYQNQRVPVLDAGRLRAIDLLLRKILPDLHHNQISGGLIMGQITAEKLAKLSETELNGIIKALDKVGALDPSNASESTTH